MLPQNQTVHSDMQWALIWESSINECPVSYFLEHLTLCVPLVDYTGIPDCFLAINLIYESLKNISVSSGTNTGAK